MMEYFITNDMQSFSSSLGVHILPDFCPSELHALNYIQRQIDLGNAEPSSYEYMMLQLSAENTNNNNKTRRSL